MPYTIRKLPKSSKVRVTAQDGSIITRETTRKKAEAQVRLLNYISRDFSTAKKKK